MAKKFLFKSTGKGFDFGDDLNKARFQEALKLYEGKTFIIQLVEAKRTLPQNDFYWFYLGVIERETGNNADDLHEYFKRKFLPQKTITVKGKNVHTFTVHGSTTQLKKMEMSDYMDKISAETGIPIPDPALAGYIK